jgi:arsenite methyltransferase
MGGDNTMAIKCPSGFDKNYLREKVKETYDQVAENPDGDFHFHRGIEFACQYLNYDRKELEALPVESTSRFAGVGNPHRIGPINKGETVLDHACGAGMDLILAAIKVGDSGKAIGIDMTPGMRENAAISVKKMGLNNVEIKEGFYEELPIDDEKVDIVISNGVVNLAPDKEIVFKEIYRILKPGGRLYLSDVVVQRELTLEARSNEDLWAACVGGALPEYELIDITASIGFNNGKITERFDCFKNTSAEVKVSKDLYVMGVNFFASK